MLKKVDIFIINYYPMGMIVSTNNRDIKVPCRKRRQKRHKCMYINTYPRLNTKLAVFCICMCVHFFIYQYNRYQKELQEKNEKIRILEK